MPHQAMLKTVLTSYFYIAVNIKELWLFAQRRSTPFSPPPNRELERKFRVFYDFWRTQRFWQSCKSLWHKGIYGTKKASRLTGWNSFGGGGSNRTIGLQVMSLTSYHCSTPRYLLYWTSTLGGVDRSRTDLDDFADRCLTAWLPRRILFSMLLL